MRKNGVLFRVNDKFGKTVSLTYKRFQHIMRRPEMQKQERKIKDTLKDPDEIRKSVKADDVFLYYKFFKNTPVSEKYLTVVVKVLNRTGS